MTRRKPLAALAAVTAAVAIAVPAASASAATTERTVSPRQLPFTPPIALCDTLSGATQDVLAIGDPMLTDLTATAADVLGCGGAAL
jgi:hypothetical protein